MASSLGYGALLLATGAEPVHLKIPGNDLPHVCYLRTLDDSRRIIEKAKNAKRAVVIGASFIGLEVAWSLRERKLEVAVVGKESLPLEKVLGREMGNLVRETHELHDVKFHLGRTPVAIHDNMCSSTTQQNWTAIWSLSESVFAQIHSLLSRQGLRQTTVCWSMNFWRRTSREFLRRATSLAGPIRAQVAFGSSIGLWRSARVRPLRAIFLAHANRSSCRHFSGAIISTCTSTTWVTVAARITRG